MSDYIVSARKYRPQTFDTVVGQSSLTITLKNAISSGKLAHAYLFCGPRGVGKTTCARIFARTINCLSPTAQGEACGECESCRTFAEGRSLNIRELDAASNNSVEDIRALIEQANMPPQSGRYKVFIIDEVHMLSTAAFNAFLKTLEEPPSYAIFILATTEKHKILPTILSRCQIYDFNRMEVDDIVAHLRTIAAREQIQCEDEALGVIARKADGGMRDALSLFDQVAGFSGGDITYKKVVEDLGLLDYDYYFSITDSLLKHDVTACLLTLAEIIGKGFEPNQFINGLAAHLRDLLVSRDARTLPLLEVPKNVQERYREQASRCSNRLLYRALKVLNQCEINYRTSPNKRLLVELSLIEAAQLSDDDAAGCGPGPTKKLKPLFQTAAAEAVPAVEPAPSVAQSAPTAPTAPAAVAPARPPIAASSPRLHSISIRNSRAPSPARPAATGVPAAPADGTVSAGESSQPPATRAALPFTPENVGIEWNKYAAALPVEYSALKARWKYMLPRLSEGDVARVEVENAFVRDALLPLQADLTRHFRTVFGRPGLAFDFYVREATAPVRIFNAKDQLADMMKRSPALRELCTRLGLELA